MDLIAFPTLPQILLILVIYFFAILWREKRGSPLFIYAVIAIWIGVTIQHSDLALYLMNAAMQPSPPFPVISPTPQQVYSHFVTYGLVPDIVLLYFMIIEITHYSWKRGRSE